MTDPTIGSPPPPDRAQRQLLVASDDAGVTVYQAFKPAIAEEAIRLGTFGRGFTLDRMTWIKPSFGWMLYRSHYATAHRQERVLRITLTHEGFTTVLGQGVPTSFDPTLFASESEWRRALARSDVRYQWDPDRDLRLRRLGRRALQLGIRGATVRAYVRDWIIAIEDVTALAHDVRHAVETRARDLPAVPNEWPYPLGPALRATLGMSPETARDRDVASHDAGRPR
jgi:hypothetical protein